jgi:diacylglycerol O-acyltransferase / wax synthase
MSYDGICQVAVNADTAAVPDPDVFGDCLSAGFDEVLAIAPPFTPARVLGRS